CIRCHRAEVHGDAQLGAALLQDLQQPPPAQRGEAGPAAGDHLPLEMDVDVVPARELTLHRAVHGGVGVLDPAQRLVGKDHTEAERVVSRVALPDGDLAARVQLPGQGGEVQPAWPAAHDGDAHAASRRFALAPTVCRLGDDRQEHDAIPDRDTPFAFLRSAPIGRYRSDHGDSCAEWYSAPQERYDALEGCYNHAVALYGDREAAERRVRSQAAAALARRVQDRVPRQDGRAPVQQGA